MADGVMTRRFGILQDITAERAALASLKRAAERDPVTGLFNRPQLMKRLELLGRSGLGGGLLLIGLDRFKFINDTFGHAAGDFCLRRIASRLRRFASRRRMIARLGGDEFALLVEGAISSKEFELIANTIRTEIQTPMTWKGSTLQVSASVGVAYRVNSAAFMNNAILSDADLALYDAKSCGGDCVSLFRADLRLAADAWAITRADVAPKFYPVLSSFPALDLPW
jgi:diguanylate cyclase (GGDEF)-like protein